MQLVTVGDRATEAAEELRKADKYQDYLYLHGFGVESAEGLAEFWHKHMRQELGFGSEDAAEIEELFHQKYRGSRYSFGYPACPNLEDRAKIVELLKADGDRRGAEREFHARAGTIDRCAGCASPAGEIF